MTFHRMLPGCEEGNPEAWRAFLANYSPMATEILGVYSPWPDGARFEQWADALRALSANACETLRGFSHQSEREFLVDVRAFLQNWIGDKLEPSQDAADPAAPTVQTLANLLTGLPLLHQEIAFLRLGGYSQATLEKILRITPTVADEGLGRLRAAYARMLEPGSEDRCLWPSAWIGICQTARTTGQKECTPLRQFVRILDGQASWYDKTPAEEHRSKCLHCMELWTSLLESAHFVRVAKPWPAEKVEPLLAAVPIKTPARPKASLLNRILGK